MAYEHEGITQLTFEEVSKQYANKKEDQVFLDVREIEEYVAGHIPGIPLIPMGDLVDLIDQFDQEKEYIFVCRSGRRSQEVAKFFKANGFERVNNYAGGILEWKSDFATGEERIIEKVEDLYNRRDQK